MAKEDAKAAVADEDEDDDLFSPSDVTGEDEETESDASGGAPGDAGGKDSDLIKKMAEALKAKNLVIPDHHEKSLREFCEHVCTALGTSEAHEAAEDEEEAGDMGEQGAAGGEGADMANPGAGGEQAAGAGAQPEQYAMMSRQIDGLKREVDAERKQKIAYLSRLATLSNERLQQKLKTIVKADLMDEPEAKQHREALQAKLLSVAAGDDAGVIERIRLIDHLYKRASKKLKTDELLTEQVELSLSANAKPVPPPESLWKREVSDKDAEEAADELVPRRK